MHGAVCCDKAYWLGCILNLDVRKECLKVVLANQVFFTACVGEELYSSYCSSACRLAEFLAMLACDVKILTMVAGALVVTG